MHSSTSHPHPSFDAVCKMGGEEGRGGGCRIGFAQPEVEEAWVDLSLPPAIHSPPQCRLGKSRPAALSPSPFPPHILHAALEADLDTSAQPCSGAGTTEVNEGTPLHLNPHIMKVNYSCNQAVLKHSIAMDFSQGMAIEYFYGADHATNFSNVSTLKLLLLLLQLEFNPVSLQLKQSKYMQKERKGSK